MAGRPDRRNEAAFLSFSSVAWTVPKFKRVRCIKLRVHLIINFEFLCRINHLTRMLEDENGAKQKVENLFQVSDCGSWCERVLCSYPTNYVKNFSPQN